MESCQLRPAFDENDPRYYGFGRRVHIRTMTIVVIVLLFAYAIILQFLVIKSIFDECYTVFDTVVTEILFTTSITGAILLIVSIKMEKKEFALAFMILQSSYAVAIIIVGIVIMCSIIFPDSSIGEGFYSFYRGQTEEATSKQNSKCDKDFKPNSLFEATFTLLMSVLFMRVVGVFYVFLSDKEKSRQHMAI